MPSFALSFAGRNLAAGAATPGKSQPAPLHSTRL
jgi:hypothetical protein